MFQKDDLIIYGNTGVCRVAEIGIPEDFADSNSEKLYYKLIPVYDSGVIFTPVDTAAFMRPVISKDEANELIAKIPDIQENIYESRDVKALSQHYQASLEKHQCEDLLQLIKTVYRKNQNYIKSGKRLGQTDQKYMKRAEEILYREFAVALSIPCDDVKDYIAQNVSEEEVREA